MLWSRTRCVRLGAGVLIAALGASVAMAQPQLELERFDESFVGAAARARTGSAAAVQSGGAVGRLLVGLSLGRIAGAADLTALRVALGAEAGPKRLCVIVTTLDGRYVAESEHRLSGGYDAPPSLGLETRYGDALAAYSADQLLVRASRAPVCGVGATGALTPADGDAERGVLLVSVNIGRGRPRAWLDKGDDRVVEPVSCKKEVVVSRTHECALPVAGLASGQYRLTVEAKRPVGGAIKKSYDVVLP